MEQGMDWIARLQNAIDYVEDHLTEELDYGEIAGHAYSSSFYFQRIFGILCGFTLGEYIRNRRLTLAGSDLASTNCKVIDAALKYGYDSPESFSRAFTKFHGVTPTEARSNRARLKSFSRISVKLVLEGGTMMDYRIEKKEAFQVIAWRKRFAGGDEITQKSIRDAWRQCGENGTINQLCRYLKPENPFGANVLGICFDNPHQAEFDYAIGVYYDGERMAEQLTVEEVPASTWMVFPCKGKMPEAFQELYRKIYTEVFPTSRYQPSCGMCIEAYPGDEVDSEDYSCEIWLSVEAKDGDSRTA